MAIKIDQAGTGIVGAARTPKHLAFINAAQEVLDPILQRKEGWEDGRTSFTGQRISNLTGWPEEVTEELLVEVKGHYEQYDRDWIGNIEVIPGKGLGSPILVFKKSGQAKYPPEANLDRAAVIAAGLGAPREGFLDDGS